MATPTAVRQINEARALARLANQGPMSRADLARDLGLTRSTASSIVASLLEAGSVLETNEPDPDRANKTGRPAIFLRLNPDHAVFLGAELGARCVRLCALDFRGEMRELRERHVEISSPEPTVMVQMLAEMVDDFVASLTDRSVVRGMNVSVPGVVNLAGEVLRAPPLGWKHVPLKDMLSDRLAPLPVMTLMNDADAFAAAALEIHGGRSLRDAVLMLMEDGVGGCILSDGQILKGSQGFAGEIGHMPIGGTGFCNITGIDGAFENYTARRAILARFREQGGEADRLGDFLTRLQNGDTVALAVVQEWAAYLGKGMALLTTLLNPTSIILGGRVSLLFPYGQSECLASLQRRLLPETTLPSIELSKIGPEGTAIGAALMLHNETFALP
ncbi:ROK family transcriptional regulator [Tropicimonas isoalkanivorans]|uniref:Sugar kinase of the NBD/HSP70 family, may contain an N-terminal HTH domain n=1 Tax=Tropicimonas isoalkanivorans TaxID=441112 RepID=A0A1I1M3J0_9RHOB|nr:ROK family transcriptional regulator [Tropicimonas isoalkanivorans]SFC79934.1 Sugar kinase of the NBD/HSP70 family, may contain an N-terminal HTH domain [Tropicimonas isoalkanivorans]